MIDTLRMSFDKDFAADQTREVEYALRQYPPTLSKFRRWAKKAKLLPLLLNAVRKGWSRKHHEQVKQAATIFSRMAPSLRRMAKDCARLFEFPVVVGAVRCHHSGQGMPWIVTPASLNYQADICDHIAKYLSQAASDKVDPDTALFAWIVGNVKSHTDETYEEICEELSRILSRLGIKIAAEALGRRVRRVSGKRGSELLAMYDATLGIRQIETPFDGSYVFSIKPQLLSRMQAHARKTDQDIEEMVSRALEFWLEIEGEDLYE
jgi:hypothetical protein